MNARTEILNRLRSRHGKVALADPFISQRQIDDLGAAFEKALRAVGGEVYRCAGLNAGLDTVSQILTELDVKQGVHNLEPPLDGLDFSERWPQIAWYRIGDEVSADAHKQQCANADIGISGAEAGLAETGTIILSSGPGRSRLATLLPPIHLALVSEAVLFVDLFAWTKEQNGEMPANITLISGPSKTADIEQTLAIGVHGPKRLIVVLY